ncbi:hypothetical protein ACFXHA_22315 [Nocardia sp. NPDC059240]|uniref:hypothetical protein n=1 Tax=Nocardia sp. NPDC059240 TaxID=3346786 RepID=UPI0036A37029
MSTPPNEPGTPGNPDDAESINLAKPGGGYGYPPQDTPPPANDPYPAYPQSTPPPYPQGGPGQPPYGQQPYGQQPYGQQPYGQPYPGDPYGAPVRSGTQTFSIIGFVCAGIALLLCPLIGIVGIVLGVVGNNKGEPLGKWAAIAAGVCMVIGFGIGLAVLNTSR